MKIILSCEIDVPTGRADDYLDEDFYNEVKDEIQHIAWRNCWDTINKDTVEVNNFICIFNRESKTSKET